MEKLSGVKARDVIGTSRHWYPFYRRERLVLADLVLENFSKKEIGRHYHGHHKPIARMKHAYEAAAFFPDLSGGAKWLLITLTAGTGGSLLAIGSAAGVALMGFARGIYTFGSHLKWAPAIATGYAASIALHIFINGKLF